MKTTRRRVLLGSASVAIATTSVGQVALAKIPLDPAKDQTARELLVRIVRVMYPHERFGDGPYRRTADAILAAAGKTPASKVAFSATLGELEAAGFAELDDAAALSQLKAIEDTAFFQLARSTAIVTLYNDAEVWGELGYEGPSFEKGGYIKRGFNDLDWLPDPRINEYGAGQ